MFITLEQIAPPWSHISALIHTRVVGSRVNFVMLRDQIVRVARFFCGFFTAMAENEASNKNQGSSLYFYAEVQFVLFYWLYKTRIDRRSYSSTYRQLIAFLHKQNWALFTDINLFGPGETSSVAYYSGETQTWNYFFLLFGRERLWRNPCKRVARGGKLWSPETLLYPHISNQFFAV